MKTAMATKRRGNGAKTRLGLAVVQETRGRDGLFGGAFGVVLDEDTFWIVEQKFHISIVITFVLGRVASFGFSAPRLSVLPQPRWQPLGQSARSALTDQMTLYHFPLLCGILFKISKPSVHCSRSIHSLAWAGVASPSSVNSRSRCGSQMLHPQATRA